MPTQNSWNSTIPVGLSMGGTNASSMSTSTGIVKYDGTSLVTSSTALIDSSNRMTNTDQPAFLALVDTTINDVTGDNTVYKIIYDTEVYDQGGNFNLGTSTFTAPVTGKYLVNYNVRVAGTAILSSSTGAKIVTSNASYISNVSRVAGTGTATSVDAHMSVLADMDLGDTLTVNVATNDSGKTDDITGATGGAYYNTLSVHLVC